MRSASAVALLSGPIVFIAYFIGALTARFLPSAEDGQPWRPGDLLLEAFVALATSTGAWFAIERVSPGSNFSRVGYLSDEVLAAWQSVALWAGLAVVVGLVAPVFDRFQGGTGMVAAAALLAAHFPWFLFTAMAGGAVVYAFTHSLYHAHLGAITVLLPASWVLWVSDWLPMWGLPTGPEGSLWVMVLSMVLGVRWWHGRPVPDALP